MKRFHWSMLASILVVLCCGGCRPNSETLAYSLADKDVVGIWLLNSTSIQNYESQGLHAKEVEFKIVFFSDHKLQFYSPHRFSEGVVRIVETKGEWTLMSNTRDEEGVRQTNVLKTELEIDGVPTVFFWNFKHNGKLLEIFRYFSDPDNGRKTEFYKPLSVSDVRSTSIG